MPVRPHRKPVVYNNHPGGNKWRPTNVSNKWKSAYQHPPRLAAVNHNQIVRVNPAPTVNRSVSYNNGNNNNNNSTIKDLRQVLDLKRTVSFESSDSATSSTSSTEKVPHSDRTNRAHIMGLLHRKSAPPVISPTTIENLKNASMAAVDPKSRVWDTWSSSEGSDSRNSTKAASDPFVPTGEPLVDLYSFTHLRKLPEPVFKMNTRKSKMSKYPLYDCKVDVSFVIFLKLMFMHYSVRRKVIC